ncbi:hypothetical protein [Agromyces mangrovi Wang et al. 2018]|uniref:hypothetical protein n=1 Tax=Agromyces mangrovi TaxID=1858653 RepID=UPI0025735DF6|nr:hypothetical protein [Agromyces mangrovi]BDZ65051.1 hypothetical protein GCM10025877_19890 [Agromyces mangrovi]
MANAESLGAPRFPADDKGIVLARSMREVGQEAELYAAVRRGDLVRIRPGAYRVPTSADMRMSAPERDARRHRLLVQAAAMKLRRPVFTGYSAVAVHGLPIVGKWPDVVEVLVARPTGSRRPGIRYVATKTEPPTVTVNGITVVTIEHALVGLARSAPLIAALTATDAALWRPRERGARPKTTMARLLETHEAMLPYRGSRRVGAVFARATDGAESPLETVSRVDFEELGFPQPELQHHMELPELKRDADVDFWWPEHGIAGEADGEGKYRREPGVDATVETVLAEKAREDAIRRRVRAFVRWAWADAWARDPLRTKLEEAGLPIVRRPPRLIRIS